MPIAFLKRIEIADGSLQALDVSFRRVSTFSFRITHVSVVGSDPKPVSKRFQPVGFLPELRPAERAVIPQFEEKCRELAGHVLSSQRGLNTPKCREELAASIQRAIENYLAFEKGKSRYT